MSELASTGLQAEAGATRPVGWACPAALATQTSGQGPRKTRRTLQPGGASSWSLTYKHRCSTQTHAANSLAVVEQEVYM